MARVKIIPPTESLNREIESTVLISKVIPRFDLGLKLAGLKRLRDESQHLDMEAWRMKRI